MLNEKYFKDIFFYQIKSLSFYENHLKKVVDSHEVIKAQFAGKNKIFFLFYKQS